MGSSGRGRGRPKTHPWPPAYSRRAQLSGAPVEELQRGEEAGATAGSRGGAAARGGVS